MELSPDVTVDSWCYGQCGLLRNDLLCSVDLWHFPRPSKTRIKSRKMSAAAEKKKLLDRFGQEDTVMA